MYAEIHLIAASRNKTILLLPPIHVEIIITYKRMENNNMSIACLAIPCVCVHGHFNR